VRIYYLAFHFCSATDAHIDPYPYADYASTLRTSGTRAVLHQMEREAIVLLENNNNTLPLSTKGGSVALIGPQSDRVTVRVLIT
jgi:beta-glucosidase